MNEPLEPVYVEGLGGGIPLGTGHDASGEQYTLEEYGGRTWRRYHSEIIEPSSL